jgi:hypothetical protein
MTFSACVTLSPVDKLLTSMEEAASRSRENLKSAMNRLAYSTAETPEDDSVRACVERFTLNVHFLLHHVFTQLHRLAELLPHEDRADSRPLHPSGRCSGR